MPRFNRTRETELLTLLDSHREQIADQFPEQVMSWLQVTLGCSIMEQTVRKYLRRLDIRWKRRMNTSRITESRSDRLDRIETTLNQILSLLQSR